MGRDGYLMMFMAHRERRPGLVKHHLLSVSVYPEYRDEPMNHIFLTPFDHTMNGECCPHGTLPKVRQAFNRWMKKNLSERFDWMVENSRREIDCGEEVV